MKKRSPHDARLNDKGFECPSERIDYGINFKERLLKPWSMFENANEKREYEEKVKPSLLENYSSKKSMERRRSNKY